MAKQTKLELSLEVFEDKLKELSQRIDTCAILEKKLDLRAKEIDAKYINIDYTAFNSAIEQSKSVFETRQKEVNKNFDDYVKTIKEINAKYFNIDYTAFNSAIEQSKSVFETRQKEVEKNFDHYVKTLKDLSKKSEQNQLYFYSALVFLFFLSLTSLAYGVTQHQKKKNAEEKSNFYRIEAQRRFQYLKEKNLSNQYEIWLENKAAKKK